MDYEFIAYNLKLKKGSPFFDCLLHLAKWKDDFPCLFCELGNYIYGVFFFNSRIDSYILKKFCDSVKRVNFDSLSSILPDLPYNFNGNFFSNNYYFIDSYYYVDRSRVRNIFSWDNSFFG